VEKVLAEELIDVYNYGIPLIVVEIVVVVLVVLVVFRYLAEHRRDSSTGP